VKWRLLAPCRQFPNHCLLVFPSSVGACPERKSADCTAVQAPPKVICQQFGSLVESFLLENFFEVMDQDVFRGNANPRRAYGYLIGLEFLGILFPSPKPFLPIGEFNNIIYFPPTLLFPTGWGGGGVFFWGGGFVGGFRFGFSGPLLEQKVKGRD